MKNKSIILFFLFANLINIATTSTLTMIAVNSDNIERSAKEIAEILNSKAYFLISVVAAVVSFAGIIVSFILLKNLEEIDISDKAIEELEDEKRKYRQATEQFVEIQKILDKNL